MESYLIACHGCTRHAIETVVIRYIRGEIAGQSLEFAPASASLSSAIRDEMAFVQKQIDLAANRVALQDHRPLAVRRPNVLEQVEAKRAEMKASGREVLMRFDSFEAFRTYSRGNKLSNDHFYLVQTGELYGAPGEKPTEEQEKIPW